MWTFELWLMVTSAVDKEAARRRGLLEDDRKLDECLMDAAASAMPR